MRTGVSTECSESGITAITFCLYTFWLIGCFITSFSGFFNGFLYCLCCGPFRRMHCWYRGLIAHDIIAFLLLAILRGTRFTALSTGCTGLER